MNFDINYFMINFSIISISIDELLNIWMRITYSNTYVIYLKSIKLFMNADDGKQLPILFSKQKNIT